MARLMERLNVPFICSPTNGCWHEVQCFDYEPHPTIAQQLLALAPEPEQINARDNRITMPRVKRYRKYDSVNDMTFAPRFARTKIKLDREDMTLINGIPNEAVSRAEPMELDGYTTLEQLAILEALDPDGPELLEYQPVHAPSDYWDLRTMN